MQPAVTPSLCPHCSQPLPQTLGKALVAETILAEPPCEPAPLPIGERRIATHDGFLWPVDRPQMRDLVAIRLRMAEDLAYLVHRRGEGAPITGADIANFGWTKLQISDHAEAAYRLATDPEKKAEAA